MNPIHPVPLIFVGLIVWRMYYRLRRNIGRQPLQPNRMITRTVILAVVTCFLAVFSLTNTRGLLGLGSGLVVGGLLALVGLNMTKFETTPEGRFYTPNALIGIGLTLLLIGRVVYRLMVILPDVRNPGQQPQLMQSPLSFFVFALLAGYYIAYYIGVLVRHRGDHDPGGPHLSTGASDPPR
jgi:heme A synthase